MTGGERRLQVEMGKAKLGLNTALINIGLPQRFKRSRDAQSLLSSLFRVQTL
jgi:hypothetical protein